MPADVPAVQRTREQGARLRGLRERLGLSKPEVCARLGFTTTQALDLYERGVSVIRLDRVSDWASAFDLSEREFLDAVLGWSRAASEPPADPWTFRGALHGKIPEAHIDGLAAEWEGRAIEDQKAAVEDILENARIAREKATRARRRRNRSA